MSFSNLITQPKNRVPNSLWGLIEFRLMDVIPGLRSLNFGGAQESGALGFGRWRWDILKGQFRFTALPRSGLPPVLAPQLTTGSQIDSSSRLLQLAPGSHWVEAPDFSVLTTLCECSCQSTDMLESSSPERISSKLPDTLLLT